MRLRLHIETKDGESGIIPVNYQYQLSAWIYSRLSLADPKFSGWLHKMGYKDGFRSFKLFCFSNLLMRGKIIEHDRLQFTERRGALEIGFLLDDAMANFISGLFKDTTLIIADKISSARFQVTTVECLTEPVFSETMKYSALSPVVVSLFDESRQQPTYISPEHPAFGACLSTNLERKLIASALMNDNNFTHHKADGPSFKLLTPPRSRLITIKSGRDNESKIRGFLFDFEMTMPVDLHRAGYYAGFGEKNSMGFGGVRVI